MNGNGFTYPKISLKKTGAQMRQLCKAKGIAVADIQKALFLASNQAVYDWFTGRNLPSLNNLFALSRLLEVPMEALLVEEDQKKKAKEMKRIPCRSEKRIIAYAREFRRRCA